MVIDERGRSHLKGDVASLARKDFHVTGGERMFESGGLPVFAPVMAVFAGRHRVVKVVPDGLVQRGSLGEIMFFIAWMTGDALEPLCLMDIGFRVPWTESSRAICRGVAGPAILVGRSPYDLEMEVVEVCHILFCIVDGDLRRLRMFCVFITRLGIGPTRPDGGSILEQSSLQAGSSLLPPVAFQMTEETIGLAQPAFFPGGPVIRVPFAEGRVIPIPECLVP